jgi:hypothetical protein
MVCGCPSGQLSSTVVKTFTVCKDEPTGEGMGGGEIHHSLGWCVVVEGRLTTEGVRKG